MHVCMCDVHMGAQNTAYCNDNIDHTFNFDTFSWSDEICSATSLFTNPCLGGGKGEEERGVGLHIRLHTHM